MKLALQATTKEEQLIKAYLEANASETLAEKINNGVHIQKDGKTLINKKTLKGFIKFACDEAKKQAEKGANSACIESDTIFGWAIHYFEEDSIEGTLYNTDGTEYKIQPNVAAKAPAVKPAPPKPQPEPQMTLFDLMGDNGKNVSPSASNDNQDSEESQDDDLPSEEEMQEILAELAEEEEKKKREQLAGNSVWQKYSKTQEDYPNAMIAMRLGDFYEVFGNNAKILAEELDLTLTSRDCGLEERIPMVGFPYHASDMYLKKLLAKGHAVVLIENDGIHELLAKQNVDLETGEILSEEEMRAFDGDIEEPDLTDDEPEFDLSAFDTEALAVLDEMFGNEITLR